MHSIEPIGFIKTPFKEKFGAPRQPGLAPSAQAVLELVSPYNDPDAVRGLEHCSHVWLIFQFSENLNAGWKPLTRPPRLGGNEKLGVFATRSTHRPNAMGLSVVKLDSINTNQGVHLNLSGIDLVDGTPVFDIKPYIPYSDALPDAVYPGMEQPEPLQQPIQFSEQALEVISKEPQLSTLIEEVLRQDPRPAFHSDETRIYGISLERFNIQFSISSDLIEVLSIDQS
ncbi:MULTISPECIES: tRNA (N6-threonylcarbamoyladenosine(37)-N6)-methyltransferase TrmO [unclassified Marinobacterium]|uniref:tRNA (N6-threonylcarbamoyladenosine(37)-N6)-methyltransferase TrmO n=1 Tax=unclassified Marinobacterium TaxID=2644139 RepID=UPI00156A164C|nr:MULTISPECIES: tRNA (N6-threonylcarbamoyladenosine(37)-N6)-methyltransferase TrmO [unclassified Marinobacterium]NRP57354.1 putative tRNA (adenine(37)-N6)-methyltransferase [Marinobacterium sp. xm-d-510]NRP97866.1 putative tRNA (adenine(37)-N6)-methyltransferase [Marinobacterium sp. xm-a-127]